MTPRETLKKAFHADGKTIAGTPFAKNARMTVANPLMIGRVDLEVAVLRQMMRVRRADMFLKTWDEEAAPLLYVKLNNAA